MKTFVKFIPLILALLIINPLSTYSQGRGHHRGGTRVVVRNGNHARRNVVVVRSQYRPRTVVVYHPVWRPAYAYHRRWVYFPRYNFYWDNWRQGYYYRNGSAWIYKTTPPPAVVNINIENEKNYELKETDDDVDDIYKTNDAHKTEYPGDTLK